MLLLPSGNRCSRLTIKKPYLIASVCDFNFGTRIMILVRENSFLSDKGRIIKSWNIQASYINYIRARFRLNSDILDI